MAENEISPEILEALLNGNGPGKKPVGPPYNPKKFAENAVAGVAMYLGEREPFKAGDVIRQRLGLCLLQRDLQHLSYVFVKYLPDDEHVHVKMPEYHHIDCVIGQADPDGDLHLTVTDSRRYEIYPQEKLDELGAEAAKAIN